MPGSSQRPVTQSAPTVAHPSPEHELVSDEQRAKALAGSSQTFFWFTAPSGEIETEVPPLAAFTGLSWDHYRGMGWLQAIHPDDRQRIRSHWLSATSAEQSLSMSYRLRRHDGEYRHVVAQSAPVRDADGRIVEWVGHCTDITHATMAEAALKQSEERFRLLDALSQATRESTDATAVMALTARLLGEHMHVTRCAYADVDTDADRFSIRNDWAACGVASSAGVYSLSLFGPQAMSDLHGGRTLVVRDVDLELGEAGGGRMFNAIGIKAVICAPLIKHGRLTAMMALHQAAPRQWTAGDVLLLENVVERCWAHIERVRDAAALREQDRRKTEFLATLAHELRNPLAPVRFATELLRRSPPGGEVAARAQDIIERQVSNMTRLIDDLLDISRVSRGLIELELERVALNKVVEAALETSRPLLDAAGHHVEVSLPAEPVWLDADATRLSQVLGNLLNNAAKYTPPGGKVRLAATLVAGAVEIDVADSGIGIPREQIGQLFQMFTQLPNAASHSQGGLGIGLALVRRLVELHGGSVRASSPGVGHGSTFTVVLPIEASVRAAAVRLEPPPPAKRTLGVRVLVVEDNADGLQSLVELLGIAGHEVRGAPDGRTAIALAADFSPQLVLLDIGLPDMSGYEVAAALRALAATRLCRLVALTGWGTADDRRKTAEAGFDEHLVKPVDPEALEAVIARSVLAR